MNAVRDGCVDVWALEVSRIPAGWEELLDGDDRARAASLRDAQARRRFVRVRAALRTILASYGAGRAAGLRFAYGPAGKPGLARADIAFNVTHAGDAAWIAVTRAVPVGIDVAAAEPEADLEPVARRFFSARERDAIAALPANLRSRAILNVWSRREALAKAAGSGMALSPDAFDVAWDDPPRVLQLRDERLRGTWSMVALATPPGAAGTVAVAGTTPQLVERSLRSELGV